MKILSKIAALWRHILAEAAEDIPSYPLVQEEWELIQAAAQMKETLRELGLVQDCQGWLVPGERT